ncbi:hypothetical protein [Azonexus hydrophilus]|uniref:hypothetical protein n=1 Tax=Azonexus hydrophilus TaxID=418702 RepID=UPI0012F84B92|nr:hypothetical protein [Azonexus hydrophilus]
MLSQLLTIAKTSYRDYGAPFLLPGLALGLIYPVGNPNWQITLMSVVQDHLAFSTIAFLCSMSWFTLSLIVAIRGPLPSPLPGSVNFFVVRPSMVAFDFASVSACVIAGLAVASAIWKDTNSAFGLAWIVIQLLILQGLIALVPAIGKDDFVLDSSKTWFRIYCGAVALGLAVWFYIKFIQPIP